MTRRTPRTITQIQADWRAANVDRIVAERTAADIEAFRPARGRDDLRVAGMALRAIPVHERKSITGVFVQKSNGWIKFLGLPGGPRIIDPHAAVARASTRPITIGGAATRRASISGAYAQQR